MLQSQMQPMNSVEDSVSNPEAPYDTPPSGFTDFRDTHTVEYRTTNNDPELNPPSSVRDSSTSSDVEEDIGESGDYEEPDEGENGPPELNNKRIILQRFTIYNSLTTIYIVGSNAKESLFRIIEITSDGKNNNALTIIEDKSYFYTRKDMIELIRGLNESIEGGIHKIAQAFGLLGFIRFTKGFYLCIITKCSQVAVIGGHFIYHVDETKLIPLDFNYRRPDKYSDEEKLLSIFKYLDLGKTFYFSYTYDITNTLQTNFLRHKRAAFDFLTQNLDPKTLESTFEHNERFVWNSLLLKPVIEETEIATYEWFQPIIHGFIDQANISIYGRKIYITIVARRSHHFAGARFLKRGVNDSGNVANEVETEQIVADMLTSSFHDPKFGFYANPRFTSFVQHRGSIPLYWTQDLNRLPKPPIEINLSDPFYQSSAIHFNNLFQRYGLPIVILNLIKTKEKQPRELKLNQHFLDCVKYLNQFLPNENKFRYYSFDMSKHSKKNLDVITPLQTIAKSAIEQTGFFHNGVDLKSTKIQRGIIRTNCIDCLDRTNAAQFIICKEALSHQLQSLGFISKSTNLDYDSDLINILTEIFHDHGDTIAVQYGGSNLVNTMDSYRRINQWSSHTRDILNSIKRIYSNSFMDLIRQEAINLFLGNYIYEPNKPKLWELQNDYYLHNSNLIADVRVKISYKHWYNENYLKNERQIDDDPQKNEYYSKSFHRLDGFPEYNDNWFNECYVPRKFQSFSEIFQFNMNLNARYFPSNTNLTPKNFDYSPFETRKPVFKTKLTDINDEGLGKTDASFAEKNMQYGDSLEELEELKLKISDNHIENEVGDLNETNGFNTKQYPGYSNSRKIKNFLTTRIEKLRYPKFKYADYNFQSNESEFETNSSNNLELKQEEMDTTSFTTNGKDNLLYRMQFLIPTMITPLLTEKDLPTQNVSVHPKNTQIYEKTTKYLPHTYDYPDRDPNSFDSSDIQLYSLHLECNNCCLLKLVTEDNYFK